MGFNDGVEIQYQDEFLVEISALEKLLQTSMESKTQKIRILTDENKQFREALDRVEQLWKKYEDDLKEKDSQIKDLEIYVKEQSETILRLSSELKEKDSALDNQRKWKRNKKTNKGHRYRV